MHRLKYISVILISVLAVTGCATPKDATYFAVPPTVVDTNNVSQRLKGSVRISEIQGLEKDT